MKKIELLDLDDVKNRAKQPGGGTGGVDPKRAERFVWKHEHLDFPEEDQPKKEIP